MPMTWGCLTLIGKIDCMPTVQPEANQISAFVLRRETLIYGYHRFRVSGPRLCSVRHDHKVRSVNCVTGDASAVRCGHVHS
jgi:hypothetical protein